IKTATLQVYAGLLATLGDMFVRTSDHTIREADRVAELTRLSDQLRQRTEELTEADRRKDEFLAMLAHELRNPMAPIRNAAQVIRLVGSADPNLQRSTELIERQVKHMTRLVDDLLDVSRITRGKITLRQEPVEPAA